MTYHVEQSDIRELWEFYENWYFSLSYDSSVPFEWEIPVRKMGDDQRIIRVPIWVTESVGEKVMEGVEITKMPVEVLRMIVIRNFLNYIHQVIDDHPDVGEYTPTTAEALVDHIADHTEAVKAEQMKLSPVALSPKISKWLKTTMDRMADEMNRNKSRQRGSE